MYVFTQGEINSPLIVVKQGVVTYTVGIRNRKTA